MKPTSTYNYKFKNGIIIISRGVYTKKYDWHLKINLNQNEEGDGQFIGLDQTIFLTKKYAYESAIKLLKKCKLI